MYFRKRTTLQTLQIRITMKRNILLLIILTVISLEASGQKYTIYVDDFNSEIKIPNRAINLIRLAFIDGIRNTNLIQREATDDGSSHRRYHSRENSYKEKFTLRLDLIRTSDGVTISTRNYEETGSASGKDATQYSALENSLINVPYEMGLFVENHFKVYGSILKVVSTKRDKAKTIYINLGYDDPIKEGLRFDVVEDGILEGHNIETKIGEIRITEIMGPKISLCKVNKGGETILTALNEGKTLKLISRQAKLFDE